MKFIFECQFSEIYIYIDIMQLITQVFYRTGFSGKRIKCFINRAFSSLLAIYKGKVLGNMVCDVNKNIMSFSFKIDPFHNFSLFQLKITLLALSDGKRDLLYKRGEVKMEYDLCVCCTCSNSFILS